MLNTDNLPEISFIDDTMVEQVLAQMIQDYKDKYEELTGKTAYLGPADPYRLIMYAATMQIYQGMQYADFAGKMSFLKYSRGDYLDNLAALRGVTRMEATAATTQLVFYLEEPIESVVAIPEGCKVTNGCVYFATDEYAEIKAGTTSITVSATCTEAGVSGNGLEERELNTVVNVLPYVVSVFNAAVTSGGADVESDDSLRERIYTMPNSYSTAGSAGAYEYFAKLSDSSISDVVVKSTTPGTVEIYIVTDGGNIPDASLIQKVTDYLDNRTIRPLTDKIEVKAPDTETYSIDLTYYIPYSSKSAVSTIQSDIDTAVSIYNSWQTEKIGRDINPSRLIQQIMAAGAKRVEITSPTFTVLNDSTIAKTGTVNVKYGGVEDD